MPWKETHVLAQLPQLEKMRAISRVQTGLVTPPCGPDCHEAHVVTTSPIDRRAVDRDNCQ